MGCWEEITNMPEGCIKGEQRQTKGDLNQLYHLAQGYSSIVLQMCASCRRERTMERYTQMFSKEEFVSTPRPTLNICMA